MIRLGEEMIIGEEDTGRNTDFDPDAGAICCKLHRLFAALIAAPGTPNPPRFWPSMSVDTPFGTPATETSTAANLAAASCRRCSHRSLIPATLFGFLTLAALFGAEPDVDVPAVLPR
jgi:hypothetical protein